MIDLSEVHEYGEKLTAGLDTRKNGNDSVVEEQLSIPKNVLVYEIDGPLFFGTVRKFEIAIERAGAECKVLIIRMRNTSYLDAGGIQALRQFMNACTRKGITIVLSGVHPQPRMLLEKTGVAKELKSENMFDNIDAALSRAREITN